jgi:CHAT domain-containing protein
MSGIIRNGQLRLPRLRFSRLEADEIMAVTPEGEGMKAVDFDASRATATSPELSQYRTVHFATHGLLDSIHPELSGLVFSMVDKNGRPQNGFLELQDIYNLNLPADLVVLSACETGLGKEISGEGLVGLTRGFMYAGASRVMASLWKVSDAGTAALMGNFYTAKEKDGLPPAAALRAAQIKMWQKKRWRNPYYWAAFQIQGEWK